MTTKEECIAIINELGDAAQELIKLRVECAGRPVVNQAAMDALNECRATYEPLARMHTEFGEKRACSIFDWQYNQNLLPECVPSDGNKLIKEMRFASGRKVDRAVFHNSGRLSIIEIKDNCDQRSVVAGIGQALLYAALAEKEYSNTPIVPVLAVLGNHDDDVARACYRGGVEYIPLGGVEFLTRISELVAIMVNYGRA
jgi:hypothetical protein